MMFIAWTQKDALLFSYKTERAPPPIFAQLFVVELWLRTKNERTDV